MTRSGNSAQKAMWHKCWRWKKKGEQIHKNWHTDWIKLWQEYSINESCNTDMCENAYSLNLKLNKRQRVESFQQLEAGNHWNEQWLYVPIENKALKRPPKNILKRYAPISLSLRETLLCLKALHPGLCFACFALRCLAVHMILFVKLCFKSLTNRGSFWVIWL